MPQLSTSNRLVNIAYFRGMLLVKLLREKLHLSQITTPVYSSHENLDKSYVYISIICVLQYNT